MTMTMNGSSMASHACSRGTTPAPLERQAAMSDLWQPRDTYRTNGKSILKLTEAIRAEHKSNIMRRFATVARVSGHSVVGYKHVVKGQPSEDRFCIYDALTPAGPDAHSSLRGKGDKEQERGLGGSRHADLGAFSLFGVFDGHGGTACADFLSKSAGRVVAEQSVLWDNDMVSFQRLTIATIDAFDTLEQKHCLWAQSSRDMSGSTAILCTYSNGVLVLAAIGDSRAVFVDHKKKIHKLSPCHTCANPKEVQRIKRQGGKIIRGRVGGIMVPTRAIGDLDCKLSFGDCLVPHPELALATVYSPEPTKRETAPLCIIASDGLWDVISAEVAVSALRRIMKRRDKNDSIDVAKELVELAVAKNSRDDITCIVIEWE